MQSLKTPCAYQGGKQRFAPQIVDLLLSAANDSNTFYYDLCCGSAAVSIELINRGIKPSRIRMLDISSWGAFWMAIGAGSFNIDIFDGYISSLPAEKKNFKAHMMWLASRRIEYEAEVYPILQANSFGGKQIWKNEDHWQNACFRDFWEPTETSIRRSPANPMQPCPTELHRRIKMLVDGMRGVRCYQKDVMWITGRKIPANSVVYIDPPYQQTTRYGFDFDINDFVQKFKGTHKDIPLFVSEGMPLKPDAERLKQCGPNGGISGARKGKHQEWVSRF